MLTHHFPRAAVPIPNRISPVKSVFGFGHRFCSRRHPRMARGSMELPPWCRHTIPKLLVDRQSPMCCSDEQFLRYGATNVLFPFGYGLSYGDFTYSHLQHESTVGACDTVHISVTVTNSGQMRASEAVQVYIQWDDAPSPTPALQLVAFTKVAVDAGASVVVTSLAIPPRAFAVLTHAATNSSQFLDQDKAGQVPVAPTWVVAPVRVSLWVGGQQPATAGAATAARAPSNVLASTFTITHPTTIPLDQCGDGVPS
eukprot:m.658872 g.658872  ORF g.658872 m.658872 type:complete len:255 (+) comp22720_c1_seq21:211-975(+)